MEEKKLNKNMGVASQGTQKESENQQRLSYEQLNDICSELYQQNQQMKRQIHQMNIENMFKRLDYLFKVIENSGKFDAGFVDMCTEEIQQAMTAPEEEEKDKKEE